LSNELLINQTESGSKVLKNRLTSSSKCLNEPSNGENLATSDPQKPAPPQTHTYTVLDPAHVRNVLPRNECEI
jgi:hypothetical protein